METAYGLSVLVAPWLVSAKVCDGGCERLISTTRPAKVSAMKISPDPSVTTPSGELPVYTVTCAPTAGTSTMRLLGMESATKTSPAASTQTPSGEFSPTAGTVV